mgnify:CR=1 FL=1|jgi:hypothetical protein
MNKKYSINKNYLIIRDKKSVNWHVEQNDYFGTLATIINLLNQDYILDDRDKLKKIFKSLDKDLRYLQKNFIIKKRD